MQHLHGPVGHCECGRPVEFRRVAGSGAHREVSCACGRRHDLELGARGWSAVAQLNPEGSVPLSGFSAELRQAPDAERFWFSYPLRGDVALPVHVVFSRSAGRAEVKAADLKVHAFEHVVFPTEARRRWIVWWRSLQSEHREHGHRFVAPRRVGRLPLTRLVRQPPSAAH
jgi:hypothetical protein